MFVSFKIFMSWQRVLYIWDVYFIQPNKHGQRQKRCKEGERSEDAENVKAIYQEGRIPAHGEKEWQYSMPRRVILQHVIEKIYSVYNLASFMKIFHTFHRLYLNAYPKKKKKHLTMLFMHLNIIIIIIYIYIYMK